MSSKLKRKVREQKHMAPFSNRQAQHMSLQFHATREQLKEMEEQIWTDAWNEAEEWSNIVNTVTVMMALNELYHYKGKVMLKIVKKSNEYVKQANEGKRTILSMMDELQSKYGFCFDQKHRDLVKKYGL